MLLGLGIALCAGCSTLPDKQVETDIVIKHKQAVDYARQGDENLVARNYTQAEVFYQQSLDANWAVDNLSGVIQAHFSLGYLYLGLGYADRAEKEYVEAAEVAKMYFDPGLIADCQLNRAKVELWRGQAQAALDRIDAALAALGNDRTDPEGIRRAAFLQSRAQALKDLDRLGEAKQVLNEALAINLRRQALKEPAANYYLLGSIANKQGAYGEAAGLVMKALELDKKAENPEGIAKDLYALVILVLKVPGTDGKPQLEMAWNLLRRSYRVSLANNDAVAVERDLIMLQDLAERQGLSDEKAAYAAALAKLKAAQAAAVAKAAAEAASTGGKASSATLAPAASPAPAPAGAGK